MKPNEMLIKGQQSKKIINQLQKGFEDRNGLETNLSNPERVIKSEKKQIQIFSEAYPYFQEQFYLSRQQTQNPNTISAIKKQPIPRPKAQSEVHHKLQQINFSPQFHNQPITIRQFRQSDLNELKKLHNQWFPLKYGDHFYKKILKRQCYCIIAETKIKTNSQSSLQSYEDIIVGAAVFQFTFSEGYVYRSWSQSFLSLFGNNQDSIYIMTLGVIDQFRKKGVGKMLVDQIIQISKRYPNIKLVQLHVISYNKAAIRFYQKMGFTNIQSLKNFYHVGKKQYDGQFYGIFVNDGQLNTGWSLTLRKLFK